VPLHVSLQTILAASLATASEIYKQPVKPEAPRTRCAREITSTYGRGAHFGADNGCREGRRGAGAMQTFGASHTAPRGHPGKRPKCQGQNHLANAANTAPSQRLERSAAIGIARRGGRSTPKPAGPVDRGGHPVQRPPRPRGAAQSMNGTGAWASRQQPVRQTDGRAPGCELTHAQLHTGEADRERRSSLKAHCLEQPIILGSVRKARNSACATSTGPNSDQVPYGHREAAEESSRVRPDPQVRHPSNQPRVPLSSPAP